MTCPTQGIVAPQTCSQMADDVREIKQALLGNEEFGVKGLVAIINDQDVRIGSLSRRVKRLERWQVSIVGAMAAILAIYTLARDWLAK